ncbi:uncharacterized protein KRP23_10575 [Phytophthora ramorum]|uniref:uncharacterized protein n=1 Tax=Phytophthora ramorum TaxID=164328 RepID=UPI0030B7536D|nr:hypothetical protein KRP23_10575 [Phytophthora ramorum]
MGLHDEFDEASAWVKAKLSETMFREYRELLRGHDPIPGRVVVGLLPFWRAALPDPRSQPWESASDGLHVWKLRAVSVGDLTYRLSYEEPLLSEAGTFQLEFAYLAHATADDSFLLQVDHVNAS